MPADIFTRMVEWMKVLMINGSPHAKGNTYIALHEMEKVFAEEDTSCTIPGTFVLFDAIT